MLAHGQEESTYKFQRYIRRSLLNTLGPVAVTGFYFFICLVHGRFHTTLVNFLVYIAGNHNLFTIYSRYLSGT